MLDVSSLGTEHIYREILVAALCLKLPQVAPGSRFSLFCRPGSCQSELVGLGASGGDLSQLHLNHTGTHHTGM